jgi:hypothetical protein
MNGWVEVKQFYGLLTAIKHKFAGKCGENEAFYFSASISNQTNTDDF